MTNGLAIQRASNAKTLILLFQDCRSTFVLQHHAKKQISTKVTSHGRQGISSSLATLLFVQQPVYEHMNKVSMAPH